MVDQHVDTKDGDELITRVATSLREPVAVRDDFVARVMAEVRGLVALPQAGREDVVSIDTKRSRTQPWLVRPRTLRISPLAGLAAAAAIAAVTVVVPRITSVIVPPAVESVVTGVVPAVATDAAQRATAMLAGNGTADAAARRTVQFVLVAPSAKSVAVVGSFNDWDTSAAPLHRDAGGVWTAQIPLLAGRYTYSFVVDGKRWQADPAAPRSVDDDFGAPSSVLTVAGAQR